MSRVNQQSQKATIQLPIPVTVHGASPKTVPRPTPPSISCSKGKTYFYLKDIDTILFSATQTVCPFSSEIEQDFTHDDPHLENLFQLRYDLSRYIQIAATPDDAELKYTGPLFQCLATIHIVSSGSTYSLSEEQKTSWKWLENTLYHAASTFSVDSLLPLEFAMLPLPSYYGYLCIHKKQCHALRCTRNSRLAFHSLVGLLNLFYGCALVRYESGRSGDPRCPLSPSETLSHSGLSQSHVCDIIDALQPEALGRCVGVVLDPTASTLGSILPWLNRIRVPIWIITGMSITLLESKSFKYCTFDIICPHGDEKLQLRALINKTIAADIKPGLSTIDPDSLH
ncbi:uncharacterized protein F5891DRAFT_1189343 [Suillus fuscotomentosus]|uniref:Uncharacterized protein n=1 Tax=Suillus fuscotomentosus TaxID=1912939 RepID=A0AAD4E5E3_9AGAM|nr:uncharacterized protein F5891DRAFT_1189343 [Suillus fuscotomentosus]KAG1899872.1 hypothetical protein F5891DRAFT_1189343 [Suillus fuscotomentosus]